MKKQFMALLLMVALSLNFTACVTVSGGHDTEGNEDAAPEDVSPVYAHVGQKVLGEKWDIALLYAKEYDSFDSGFHSQKPSEGNKYLVLFFDVKNASSEDDYFNYFLFEGYADDYSVKSLHLVGDPDGMSTIGGDLDAGKMSKGYIAYEVPSDWEHFEISYREGAWTTDTAATFVVNKEDVSAADYTYTKSAHSEYSIDASKKTKLGTKMDGDKWSITLDDVKRYGSVGETYTQTADDGMEFVIFYLEAENLSSASDYFNQIYFRSYVDGYITGQTHLISDIDGYSWLSGNVAAGKKIKGYVAIQAPLGWNSIELIYDDGTFVENKTAEFVILNE